MRVLQDKVGKGKYVNKLSRFGIARKNSQPNKVENKKIAFFCYDFERQYHMVIVKDIFKHRHYSIVSNL
jgi:hypothetical protein